MPQSLNDVSLWQDIGNWFSGNVDYQRNVAVNQANNQFSAKQAALARQHATEERQASELYNSAEAQKNRDWQEYMSNTAMQRQVADIKAAGFNPLGLLGGSGASLGSSTTAHAAAGSSPAANATGSPHFKANSAVGATIGALSSSAATLAASTINTVTRSASELAEMAVKHPHLAHDAKKAAVDLVDLLRFFI